MDYKDINIVYEDNHLLVVVKPQNILSQGDETGDIDMLTLLKQYIKETSNKTGNVYLGLVHRLDRPTGGVMVFAKTSKAAARLSESIKSGDFEKNYLCVVVGKPREKHAILVNYLKKNTITNNVYVASEATIGAKRAELEYYLLEERQKISLLKVCLQTGRSHQIRVQLSHIGCPVFGDTKYGGDALAKGYPLNLWAYSLKFTHPVKEQKMYFVVMPPREDEAFKRFELDSLIETYVSEE